ncbi:MAG: hypothetical protein RR075_05980 [Pygmaiobacter sp.]
MRKILTAILACAMVLSLNIGAFADSASMNITAISGRPVYDTGAQFKDALETVTPDQTIYFALPTSLANWTADSRNFKLNTKKTTNPKLIKSITLVEKRLTSNNGMIEIPNTKAPVGSCARLAPNGRNTYLAVTLNDMTGTEEMKTAFTATFTVRKQPVNLYYGRRDGTGTTQGDKDADNKFFTSTAIGDKLELKGTLYVGNTQTSGDSSVTVGKQGVMVKPDKNADNEIVFEADDTLATLTFRANSNPNKFLAKLSTNWTKILAQKFSDTDAVVRAFSPATIGATSRATLALNNPFDTDYIDPSDVYIYTADSKGNLTDITRSVAYDRDDDCFVIKTRTLTTYILSDVRLKAK